MKHQEVLTRYLNVWINAMIVCGVTDVVISPGSRSTPLAILFEERRELTTYLDIDERSAGFLALGLAKAKCKTVALLCTSGTAAANYYPAVVEAQLSRVPLLVLTSDRPYELQNVGAPQTIGQKNLYGSHVKGFFQIEIPENDLNLLEYNQMIAARSIASTLEWPQGPVHLNFPFREPLLPDLALDQHLDQAVVPRIHAGIRLLPMEEMLLCKQTIEQAQRGVIVCGPIEGANFSDNLIALSEKTGFPILADPLSQLRRGSHPLSTIIDTYDTFLKNETVANHLNADLILRFGAMPVSKSLMFWLKKQQARQWVIDSGAAWRDPSGTVNEMFYCDEQQFCDQLHSLIEKKEQHSWMESWRTLNKLTKEVLLGFNPSEKLTEEHAFQECLGFLPDNAHLFAGNSMPIRVLDTFLFNGKKRLTLHANRGANGIDGVVSTAVGVSLVNPKTYLMIGDLSFFHDMNGLLAARHLKANLTIILINNDGGGIFSFLPQAADAKHFESLFGTPHGLNFSHSAGLYGAFYRNPATRDDLVDALSEASMQEGLSIIEISTKRAENVQAQHEIAQLLDGKLRLILAGEGS
ncbi:MAG: 2-succinyl-5-enolpyruvyl-6-hydroxy-3-cyclohexene-1-carboxylic-acid synthase [Sporolactobacillus sp.]